VEITMSSSHSQPGNLRQHQRAGGFSLLEMIVAMFILTIGLLGVASAIGYALMASNSGRGLTNAKLLVVSALEQMETLRDSGQLNFAEISNSQVSGSTFTGFPTTFLPVSTVPGPDFVYGTLDDPGRTDPTQAVTGVTRQILITSLSPTLKRIQVTLRYAPNGGASRDLVCASFLNDDSHGNYVP
jgi:prepilin-type N-terminal cleavage/methylation domain-containing protein